MASIGAKQACFLIADGDPDYAADVARILRPRGSAVLVGTRREAITTLSSRHAWTALLIGDPLPDGSGLDVVEALAMLAQTAPALLLASSVTALVARRAYILGAAVVVKPVDPSLVLLFAERSLDVRPTHDAALVEVVAEWDARCRLAPAQSMLLARMALGATRAELAAIRRVKLETVRKDITRLLARTGHGSMPALLQDLHAEVIARMERRHIEAPAQSETRLRAATPLSVAEIAKRARAR